MNSFLTAIDSHTILFMAAIAVSLLSLKLILQALNASWRLILAIAVLVLVLQYGFGIAPDQLWTEISQLPQDLLRFFQNFELPEIGNRFAD